MNGEKLGECVAIGNTSKPNEPAVFDDTTPVKIVGIYGLRCRTTDKWYVGQSWNIYSRWNRAYKRLHCKAQRKLYNALVKYGYDAFEKRIIEQCDADIPQDMLDIKESSWIQHFNSVEHGYNLSSGGASNGKLASETIERIRKSHIGLRPTVQTREKMSMWQIGRKLPDKTLRKMSENMRGKNTGSRSTEIKAKIAKSMTGLVRGPMSDEHKQKISDARKRVGFSGKRNPFFGKTHSTESLEKIRLAKSFTSDETRRKMSDSAKLRCKRNENNRAV